MSIKSMTGHGRGEAAFKDSKIVVERNSVNPRQFDLRIDLPPFLSECEDDLRRLIHTFVARGAVLCRCHFLPGASVSGHHLAIDYPLAAECLRAARRLATMYRAQDNFGISSLFAIPGVIRVVPTQAVRPGLKKACLIACRCALRSLVAMRAREGNHLACDVDKRLKSLEKILTAVACRVPAVRQRFKFKIKTMLREASGGTMRSKLLRDILAIAERGDIEEEISRSKSHIDQFRTLLAGTSPAGRTMDFLVQEMMREINTIGSKSNDCFISKQVVHYKTELENIREQVQNIE